MSAIRVYIVDDHEMVVTGLISMLESKPEIDVMGFALNAEDALIFLETNQADVILVNINLPEMDGVALCKAIMKKRPHTKVIALSSLSEISFVKQMVQNGAKGYLLKNTSGAELVSAIKAAANDEEYFSESIRKALFSASLGRTENSFIPKITRREKEVLSLITEEYSTKAIADKLFISTATVDTHRKHLLHKLGAKNTAGLVKIAIQKGLIN